MKEAVINVTAGTEAVKQHALQAPRFVTHSRGRKLMRKMVAGLEAKYGKASPRTRIFQAGGVRWPASEAGEPEIGEGVDDE